MKNEKESATVYLKAVELREALEYVYDAGSGENDSHDVTVEEAAWNWLNLIESEGIRGR